MSYNGWFVVLRDNGDGRTAIVVTVQPRSVRTGSIRVAIGPLTAPMAREVCDHVNSKRGPNVRTAFLVAMASSGSGIHCYSDKAPDILRDFHRCPTHATDGARVLKSHLC